MKNVLVYGDLMIDRSWIVSGRTESTAQSHADVTPMRRIDPSRLDDSLGGAGMTASAVAHLCSRYCKVHLLAASGPLDERVLGSVKLVQIPRHREYESVTTTKFRIYNVNEKGLPVLRQRFDQDAPPPVITGELPNNLPPPAYLILSDFKKGAVQPLLLKKILAGYPDAEVFVDTKDKCLFDNCPELIDREGTLFINRQEATRLWQLYRNHDSDLDISLALRHCLVDLLEMGRTFLNKLPRWGIVVKLDKDGAVLFHNNSFYVQEVHASKAPGIGAGDVFLASWLQGIFLGASNKGQLLKHAATTATAWVDQPDAIAIWEKAWQAGREAPVCADISVDSSLPESFPDHREIARGIEEERALATYPKCIEDGSLDLSRADFGVGKFRVLDPSRRRDVVRFVQKIRDYLKRESPTRPYNCVLSAKPGTGKSFLLKQLETDSLRFYELNVAQFASPSEFMGELARIAAKGDRQRILMIDEADTELSGFHIYPLLLAPLWDGTVIYSGESRSLGSHFVSVLVTSRYESPADFREALRKTVSEKGPDLESRLSGADLKLTAPTGASSSIATGGSESYDADYAILIGSIVRRYYPHVRWVSRMFLDMLYEKSLPPRDLEYALLRLESPADGYISPEDVIKLHQALGYAGTPPITEQGKTRIQIIDVS